MMYFSGSSFGFPDLVTDGQMKLAWSYSHLKLSTLTSIMLSVLSILNIGLDLFQWTMWFRLVPEVMKPLRTMTRTVTRKSIVQLKENETCTDHYFSFNWQFHAFFTFRSLFCRNGSIFYFRIETSFKNSHRKFFNLKTLHNVKTDLFECIKEYHKFSIGKNFFKSTEYIPDIFSSKVTT